MCSCKGGGEFARAVNETITNSNDMQLEKGKIKLNISKNLWTVRPGPFFILQVHF